MKQNIQAISEKASLGHLGGVEVVAIPLVASTISAIAGCIAGSYIAFKEPEKPNSKVARGITATIVFFVGSGLETSGGFILGPAFLFGSLCYGGSNILQSNFEVEEQD